MLTFLIEKEYNLLYSLQWQTNLAIVENADYDNKNEQTTNENRLIRKFRNRFIECLLQSDSKKFNALVDEIVSQVTRCPREVRTNSSAPRKSPRNSRFHDNQKSVSWGLRKCPKINLTNV